MNLRRLVAGMVLALAASAAIAQEDARLVSMGTGNVAAVYYPVGVALCRLVNEHRRERGLRCSARTSEGSVANIAALRDKSVDLAIVQSDIQSAALKGSGGFADAGPFEDLRAIMSLYPEPLTIVAAADAGIASFEDLEGKRVSVGPPGSGQRLLMDLTGEAMGWTAESFAGTPELESTDVAAALCAGDIDAFVLVVGHPALVVQEASRACDTMLIAADNAAVGALVEGSEF
jgi:TRAP transporter TAXI family solute receptor